MESIRSIWQNFSTGEPFTYSFLDDRFDEMYRTEQRMGRLFGIFAGLAIFIGCLGLVGLAAYIAEQKTKEIGIRKVMGATVPNIIVMMVQNFGKLVLIAVGVAVPLGYYFIYRYFQTFAYRTSITAWPFILAGCLGFVIALLTVSIQAVRAAYTDPTKALRYE